jgi:hypothetical protein
LPVRVIRRRARLAALAPCCFSVPLAIRPGLRRQVINPSLFLPSLQLLLAVCLYQRPLCSRSSALPRSASTPALLLATLVAISRPCLVQAFCPSAGLEISTPTRLFNRESCLFSSFGNLILVQADASFQLVSELPILLLRGNYM